MREVISLNGVFTPWRAPRALTARLRRFHDMDVVLTVVVYSRPGRLPDRQLLLGGQ